MPAANAQPTASKNVLKDERRAATKQKVPHPKADESLPGRTQRAGGNCQPHANRWAWEMRMTARPCRAVIANCPDQSLADNSLAVRPQE